VVLVLGFALLHFAQFFSDLASLLPAKAGMVSNAFSVSIWCSTSSWVRSASGYFCSASGIFVPTPPAAKAYQAADCASRRRSIKAWEQIRQYRYPGRFVVNPFFSYAFNLIHGYAGLTEKVRFYSYTA